MLKVGIIPHYKLTKKFYHPESGPRKNVFLLGKGKIMNHNFYLDLDSF